MRKAGELGFTSVDIPEEYGGMGMDKTTSTLITDHLSVLASFSTAFGAHIGIATLPLVWYGTEEQKQRYLPKLGHRRVDRRLRALRGQLRLRRHEHPHPRHALARRQHLHAQRREDVDHQLRHRRPLHRLRQDRRREILRVPGRARHAGPDRRRRGAQAGHSRLLHLPAGAARTARFPPRTCSARPARATTSPSTC